MPKQKLLYVTSIWSGFADILNGAPEAKGMPAFIKPLRTLLEQGHDIDMILIDAIELSEIQISAKWALRINFLGVINTGSIVKNALVLGCILRKLLKTHSYDFIYGHGSYGVVANLIANRYKIPFGQRLYGVFLWNHMKSRGPILAKFCSPLEYLVFVVKKKFLLVTDDGSGGDKVYASIKLWNVKKRYFFAHWLNGIDPPTNFLPSFPAGAKTPFLFYPARIDCWKRQDIGIELLHKLRERGLRFHLYLPGHMTDMTYVEKLKLLIAAYGLEDQVHFLQQINRAAMTAYELYALANLFFYDISNKGNAFYETFAAGGIIVAKNDHTLDSFIQNGVNGFLANDTNEAAEIIVRLAQDDDLCKTISSKAREDALALLKSWDARVENELKLIKE